MKKAAKLLTLLTLIMILTACARQADTTEDAGDQDEVNGAALHGYTDQSDLADEYDENGGEASEAIQVKQPRTEAERDENLVKLGKVWGFVKYTHNAFITGAKCWDEELLRLIPIVYNAHPSEVNGILYDWFISLGDDGYDAVVPGTEDADLRQVADLSWINYDYLGQLSVHLLRFNGTPVYLDRSQAPVYFNFLGAPVFYNQIHHSGMDFGDSAYRILALFRLWNAMKYYYPHLGILDVEWNDLLPIYIPKMLDGEDRLSYELTLAMLSHHVRDSAHLNLFGATFFNSKFGRYIAPVWLIEAEKQLVVYAAASVRLPTRDIIQHSLEPFETGDVILKLNGREIDEVTAEMLRLVSYPDEEKALAYLALMHHSLRSHTRNMEVTVLRGDARKTLNVDGVREGQMGMRFLLHTGPFHMRLDNNIGLINPAFHGNTGRAMDDFADTDGIIIDLRQRPGGGPFPMEMKRYLVEENLPFGYLSFPLQTHPGVRSMSRDWGWNYVQTPYTFIYDRPVVLLMNEETISFPESVVMYLRVAPNVTVIGPWSMGSNGNIVLMPLPCGINMSFTSLGVYTLDGGQTHRIGLEPDIRVDRTTQGIAEGRDEIMEAAIEFILGS